MTVIGYWHGYPEKGEATSSYLLEHDGWRILLDCGSGALSRLPFYCPIEELDAIVLSHYHHDHYADIGPFQYARLMKKGEGKQMKDATIFGPADGEAIKHFEKLAYKDVVKAAAYDEETETKIGPFTFSFIKTIHPAPCYAMKIECGKNVLVYTADTSYFDELALFAKDADLLIAECSGYKGDAISDYGHMTSTCVGKLAKKARPGQLLLSHLPHYGDHEQLRGEVSQLYKEKVILAKSGLTIQL